MPGHYVLEFLDFYTLMLEAQATRNVVLVLLTITMFLVVLSLLVLCSLLWAHSRERHRSLHPGHFKAGADLLPCMCCPHSALHVAEGLQVRAYIDRAYIDRTKVLWLLYIIGRYHLVFGCSGPKTRVRFRFCPNRIWSYLIPVDALLVWPVFTLAVWNSFTAYRFGYPKSSSEYTSISTWYTKTFFLYVSFKCIRLEKGKYSALWHCQVIIVF